MQAGGENPEQLYRLLAQNGLIEMGAYGGGGTAGISCCINNSSSETLSGMQSFCSSNSCYYPLELDTTPPPPLPHDRALAALKNHKEAEKRRRERINSHLDKLRTLLPSTLLGKVVERVRELKEETSEISREVESLPSESDEISVVDYSTSSDGRLIFKASLCCEDRSDLIPDLIEILKSLHLKTLKSEMATLGGRFRNVLIVAADKPDHHSIESLHFLQNAFKSLLERSNSSSERSKRRRCLDRKLFSST
ncbi:hypothetical protein FEM48_Zijuj12G0013400 [Ziziphus jujuba var. spinosa]|uniref:BHLH domain-containing protein n=1 Tax=Ziziphus jujuba var. spinosa TaxID=714518 RepID=A0A978UAD3_ZIZJJ|nr:hypothetical protein FEM48_Zijuj12G0013400 [Ziziphus jujuba var. spinosa]